jgi:hypothetical protein
MWERTPGPLLRTDAGYSRRPEAGSHTKMSKLQSPLTRGEGRMISLFWPIKSDMSQHEFLKKEGYVAAHFPNGIALKAAEEFVSKVKRLCEELQLRKVEKG